MEILRPPQEGPEARNDAVLNPDADAVSSSPWADRGVYREPARQPPDAYSVRATSLYGTGLTIARIST